MKEEINPFEIKGTPPERPLSVPPVTFPKKSLVVSLLVMSPWPILGIAACVGLSLFEKSHEAIMLFGGVTMIFLVPLAFFVTAEWIFGTLIGISWLSVALLPLWLANKSQHPMVHGQTVYILQSLFSAAQAGLGFLIILGKQC